MSLTEEPPHQPVTLFYFNPDSQALAPEVRQIRLSPDLSIRLKQVISAQLEDPISGLQRTLPTGTFIYEAYVDAQSVAYLDFSRHLVSRHIGGTDAELLTVKTLLQTVKANFPNRIQRVQILVEGLEANTIAGHLDISRPLALKANAQQ